MFGIHAWGHQGAIATALRHGDQTNAVKALYRLIAQWRRETQALLARAVSELAMGESPDTLLVGPKAIIPN